MRHAFARTLAERAERDPSVMLLTGDLGYSVLEEFRDRCPRQFLNAGIAEQNMASAAAGLALSGKTVFVYSIVPFVTFRCLEQIRDDVCYHRLPVCFVGVGAGYGYGHMGATHHAVEDVAVMRAIPGMSVLCPAGRNEVEQAVRLIADRKAPCYLRLDKGKAAEDGGLPQLEWGKARTLRSAGLVTIAVSGALLPLALEVADALAGEGIPCGILQMPFVKPFDEAEVLMHARSCQLLVTLEDHGIVGGLGSAAAEVMAAGGSAARLLPLGLPAAFCEQVGSTQYLRSAAGLDAAGCVRRIRETLSALPAR